VASAKDITSAVPLPPGLEPSAIRRAIDYMEKELTDLVEIYYEQANVFSAIVGIFGTRALNEFSNYEKNKHTDTAQQRFPDLCRKGFKPDNPQHCLESKGSKRHWAIQSHYDHPGWYIVWRYLVDKTESFEAGKSVIIWRVDVVFLTKADWQYEGSSASEKGGGRTHTFAVIYPAKKLKDCAVYKRKDVIVRDGKPIPRNGHG
jgi:hypothetical protein